MILNILDDVEDVEIWSEGLVCDVQSNRKKPPVQYVRCEIEGCGTVLAHPRYLQVCLSSQEFFASLSVTQNRSINVAAVFEKVMSIVSDSSKVLLQIS